MEADQLYICNFIKYLTDEDLKWLLKSEAPVFVSEHLDICEECSKRLSKIKPYE